MADARLGIDMDGVLANTVPSVLERIEREYGPHGATKEDVTEWSHSVEAGGKEIHLGTEILEGHKRKDDLMSIEPKRGAKDGLRALRDMGYELVVVTDRPSNEDTVGWSKGWLRKNGLPYDKFHSTAETRKTSVGVDVLVDDHHTNVADFLEDGRPAVLFDQPWNTVPDVDGPTERMRTTTDWEETVEALDELTRE